LVDHAGGHGVQKLTGRRGVTSDLHIRFLAAARAGSVLRAEARVVRAGRSQIVMDVKVIDASRRAVAVAGVASAVLDGQTTPSWASPDGRAPLDPRRS
jgi:uncharacterized protein (TIGR00369 family)